MRVTVSGDEAVVVRDLSLSVAEAPTLAALDSAGATVRGLDREPSADDSLSQGLYLTGTASVSGVVLGEGGRPLGDVEIRVVNARPVTRSDAAGRFMLNNLPSGTQLLAVRRIGYLVGDVAVELRPNRNVSQNILLRRVVSLDSIRVVARRSRYADFEYRRRNSPSGRFLTANDLAKQKATELAPVIQRVGGFTVVGFGPNTQVLLHRRQDGPPELQGSERRHRRHRSGDDQHGAAARHRRGRSVCRGRRRTRPVPVRVRADPHLDEEVAGYASDMNG